MRGNESSASVLINIEMLENYLNIKSRDAFDKIQNLSSICKVKNRNGDNVFDPVIVSIGPYHHEEKTLQAMNQMKWNWMDNILKINGKITLQDYIKSLKEVEHIARSYYTEEIKMGSSEFINMLLLDGFFVLVFLCAIELHEDLDDSMLQENPNNEIKPLQFNFVIHDILLVENQIPFFVLKILYKLFIGEENTAPSLSEVISHYMEHILGNYPKSIKETSRPRNFHHLLHLCHIYVRPSQNFDFNFVQSELLQGHTVNCWRTALQYHVAGVKFKKREMDENNPHSLLDLKFINNVLEIPYLFVDENTQSHFKNLIELEKANPNFGNDVAAYIVFMSQLVKDPKDVALLVSKGIIEHDFPREEEILDIFMRSRESITFDYTRNFYLKSICHNLEVYYQSRMKCWTVWFRRTASAMVQGWF